jgi:hypothetical protein
MWSHKQDQWVLILLRLYEKWTYLARALSSLGVERLWGIGMSFSLIQCIIDFGPTCLCPLPRRTTRGSWCRLDVVARENVHATVPHKHISDTTALCVPSNRIPPLIRDTQEPRRVAPPGPMAVACAVPPPRTRYGSAGHEVRRRPSPAWMGTRSSASSSSSAPRTRLVWPIRGRRRPHRDRPHAHLDRFVLQQLVLVECAAVVATGDHQVDMDWAHVHHPTGGIY